MGGMNRFVAAGLAAIVAAGGARAAEDAAVQEAIAEAWAPETVEIVFYAQGEGGAIYDSWAAEAIGEERFGSLLMEAATDASYLREQEGYWREDAAAGALQEVALPEARVVAFMQPVETVMYLDFRGRGPDDPIPDGPLGAQQKATLLCGNLNIFVSSGRFTGQRWSRDSDGYPTWDTAAAEAATAAIAEAVSADARALVAGLVAALRSRGLCGI